VKKVFLLLDGTLQSGQPPSVTGQEHLFPIIHESMNEVAPDCMYFIGKCRTGIKLLTKSVVTSDIRLCRSDVTEKLDNNLRCKREVWCGEVVCPDFAMITDEVQT
jgi:hypothetical protein